ncbi:MAG: tRNA (adenosine(37)-N6)-threonylcarbamoyltransferase complex transferase subunit TsaD [Desulfobulbaceae bacterium]|nr:tRNA (adenosine(37)-N6)-threonylcarbamoyltransferase complex transferase subunit TsaD [Desulfobulbaceae bacterium]
MYILAIESSCDDTSAAVLEDDRLVLSNVVSSQFDVHARYGGIVPELASRRHIESIWPVVHSALDYAGLSLNDIDLIAATRGPGLVGSLLVGFTFAKAVALVNNIPCVGVDHMAGHLLSAFLEDCKPQFPYIALIVSGGNTTIFEVSSFTEFRALGRTRDDAAGEAYDKVAKLLQLGYPGGPIIDKLAASGNPEAFSFPRAWLGDESLDFSFSGLKTSVLNQVNHWRQKGDELNIPDLCCSFQSAVVEVLVEKTLRAAKQRGISSIVVGGGVGANSNLRHRMARRCEEEGYMLHLPSPVYCTDNGAMIAIAGYHAHLQGDAVMPDTDVYPRSQLNLP